MQATSPLVAPEAGELVLQFVNTNASGKPEAFSSIAGLHEWLAEVGLDSDVELGEGDVASARDLRDALQAVLLAHSDRSSLTDGRLAGAERYLAAIAPRYPVMAVVGADATELRPSQTGLPGVFGRILASIAEISGTGTWNRFKACQNPICHESFFDRSRNGLAKYHAASCSSMVAMRAYRLRKSQANG